MIRALPAVFLLSALSSLAAGRMLPPRELAPTPYSTHLPATAFAGERFLTVWFEQRANFTLIMGAFSDADGQRVSEQAFPILVTPMNHSLQLLGTGDSYAMFWRDNHGEMWMADLNLAGHVTALRYLPFLAHSSVRMAWNGAFFLALVSQPTTGERLTEAFLLDREGRIVRPAVPVGGQPLWFDIAAGAEVFTVVTGGWDGLFAHRVAIDGTSVATTIERSTTASRALRAVAIAKENGDVLVIWSASGVDVADLKSVVLRPNGELSEVHVAGKAGVAPIHLMPAGDGYLLATLAPTEAGRHAISSMAVGADGSFGAVSTTAIEIANWRATAASNGAVIQVVANPVVPAVSQIASVALSPNGTATGPAVLSNGRGRQLQPALGAGGGTFLISWPDQNAEDTLIRTTTINALGDLSTVRTLQPPAFLGANDLAWNGSEYLALTWSGTWLMARRVAFDGAPIDAEPIVVATDAQNANSNPTAALTWADDRWVVVYPSGEEMMFATVSRAGVVTPPRSLSLATPLPPNTERLFTDRPAIAFDGRRLLMVWSEKRLIPCPFPICDFPPDEAFAIRLDRDGNVLDAEALRLPDEAASGAAIATSGEEFLVIPNFLMRAFVIDGDRISLQIASSTPLLEGASAMADVLWDGAHYVVALRYQQNFAWHVGLVRLDRRGDEVEPLRAAVTRAPETFTAPSIAVAPGLGTLIATQERDLVNGARAIVYREDELNPQPTRRRSVR